MAKLWAISLVLISTLLTSTAQIFYKLAADNLSLSLFGLLGNIHLFAGLSLYAVGAIFMIVSFRGGEVSVLYPIFATSYIWVSFLAFYFLGEAMPFAKWMGVLAIFLGVALVGYGGKE